MTNEHNPIAQLVTRIQHKWLEDVSPFPDIRLVRWLIDQDESELYEGFLMLESSPQGIVPEIMVTLLTPFEDQETYSQDLIRAWLDAIDKDADTFIALAEKGNLFNWDDEYFRKQCLLPNIDHTKLLLEMLGSFQHALQMGDRTLTLALFHYSLSSTVAFNDWLKKLCAYDIPEHVRLMLFDLKKDRHYDKLFSSLDPSFAKTLLPQLDLPGAIKKIIQSGDPNEPGVQLQKYIQEMAELTAAGNLSALEDKGNACITDMHKTKIRSLTATAHLVLAGMLFNFRKYERIEELLNKGLEEAVKGEQAGDSVCASLVQQYYNFTASAYQLNKKHALAIDWFRKSGDLSLQSGLPMQALTAYRHAYTLAHKHESTQYAPLLLKAVAAGEGLEKEELLLSEYMLVCLDQYEWLRKNGSFDESDELDANSAGKFGKQWKQTARERSAVSKKTLTA